MIESLERRVLFTLPLRLDVAFASRPPMAVIPGDKAKVSIQVSSVFDRKYAGGVTIGLFLSSDRSFDEQDLPTFSAVRSIRLRPWAAKVEKIDFAWPSQAEGSFHLIARLSYGGTYGSAVASTEETVELAPPFARLSAQSVSMRRPELKAGSKSDVTLSLRNAGNIALSGSASFELFLSDDEAIDAGDRSLLTADKSTKLRPSQIKSLRLRFLMPSDAAAGRRFLIARATAGSDVSTTATTVMIVT